MSGPGTTDPSPRTAARRALADEVQELRTRCINLESSVQELEGVYSTNKELRAKVLHLENELVDFKQTLESLLEFQTRATKLLQVLVSNHDVNELKHQILSLALLSNDPNTFLKSVVDEEQESGENGENGGGTGSGGTGTSNLAVGDAERVQLKLRDSQPMKDAVNKSLLHLYGAVRELKPEHSLYPHGLTRSDPGWPGEGVGNERRTYLRFDLTKPSDDPINVDSFKEFCKFVRNRGAERVPGAAEILQQATDDTIQERCQMKYKYEADKHRKYLRQQAQASQDTAGNEDGEDENNVRKPPRKRATAYYRSRAEAKMKARGRKLRRMVLTYSTTEMATFATHGAQSDDESEYETVDGSRRKTGNYLTRGWPFMSERFQTLKSLVDETDDPVPPPRKSNPRKPGTPREGNPPHNQCNQFLLREWMIDPVVLEEHPEWRRRRLVIPDDEPIQTLAPAQANKRKNESNAHQINSSVVPNAKKARLDLSTAQGKLEQALAGETLEDLGLALMPDDEKVTGTLQDGLDEEEEEDLDD